MRAFFSFSRRALLCLALTFVSTPGTVRAAAGSLADEINGLLMSPRVGKMRVGVQIVLLDERPRLILEHNSSEPFKPASNQKILTTAAAMALLPQDFTFKTILARRGDDLVVIGAGDPATGDPKLARGEGEAITALFREWADKLKAAGVGRISGDLVFDDYVFEQEHIHPNWAAQFKNQMQNWYVAPVGGLNFNDNCVDVVVKPGPGVGEPAQVTLIPNTPYIELSNRCKTAKKGDPIIRRTGNGTVTVSVSGSVSRPGNAASATSLTVTDPGMFFASTLRTVLAAKGIAVDGQTRRQRVRLESGGLPGDLQIIARHEQGLDPLFERSNRDSQNLFAEALLKAVGAYVGAIDTPRVGSYETGRRVVELFLTKLGLAHDGCVIDDGSGLSHSNRVTPAVLAGVLIYMDRHPRQKQWLGNLATAGGEGTLRRRMKELNGKMYGKTGHISGVSTLSGYVFGPNGRRYAFAILCNDSNGYAHPLQDSICRTLATWGGPLPGEGQ